MKVLITGAYSSGKTSLVHQLSSSPRLRSKFPSGIVLRDDPSRDCPLPLNRQQTIYTSLWLAGRVISEESRLTHGRAPEFLMLCDRGMPDFLSHTPYEGPGLTTDFESTLWGLSSEWMLTYSMIFLSRVDHQVPIDPDGLRVCDSSYRAHLEQRLLNCLEKLNHPVITLPHEQTERIRMIESAINSFYKD